MKAVARHSLSILFSGMLLAGCQTPLGQLQELASTHARQVQTLPGSPFPLVIAAPKQVQAGQRLRVYLEGDGHAWATPSQPSLDPSPRQLLVADLAFADPMPAVYLARPCQFVSAPACNNALWTNRRYAEEVVHSLDLALDDIGSGFFHCRIEIGLGHRLAAFAREHQIEQGFGARQAADVGGEEAGLGHAGGLDCVGAQERRKLATAALKASAPPLRRVRR